MSSGLHDRIVEGIENKIQRQSLGSAMRRGREGRKAALLKLDETETFTKRIRQIKESAIENSGYLVAQFVQNAMKRGAKIFLAKDGASAMRYIEDVARTHNAKLIAKSKSLTSEEIEMNNPLAAMGYEVVETDLGERIIQLANEKPIHLVFPAAHKNLQQVAEIFSSQAASTIPPDHTAIMSYVRKSLRDVFLNADIGVTGANIAIAETGTVVIETNEGNARLVTSIPQIQITIVGEEKIVPTIEDALQILQAHPVSATGQMLTTYVSFISGRCPLPGDGPRELHIVLLDNGRSAMRLDKDFREALYCIRCGACMNICPTYEVVGGHVFGYIYPGPIGIPWTARVHGLDKAQFAALCISCGLCREICPAEIDIPYMIAKVKQMNARRKGQGFANRIAMRADEFAKLASLTAPLSNWVLRRGAVRYLMDKALRIDRRRRLPTFTRHTFLQWWSKHKSEVQHHERRVAYFFDAYANYSRPDIGIKAVRLLEEADVEVAVPPQQTSGMPYFSYGELDEIRKVAAYNVSAMLPYVQECYTVLATEPTVAYCFKELYPRLLETEESRLVAEHTREYLDYFSEGLKRGFIKTELREVFAGKAGFHISCHQRALTGGRPAVELMRAIGLDVAVIETDTCCGMGGTFGLKAGALGYELSREVGEPLFGLFKKGDLQIGLTESSVCTMHLQQGTGLPFDHPVAVLAAAIEGRSNYVDSLVRTNKLDLS